MRHALKVRTHETLPRDYQTTMTNLGHLHFEGENWAAAHEAYGAAIDVGVDLLATAVTEGSRLMEVGETTRLYVRDAFALLRLGRPGEALLRLELGKTRLLREALALADLDLTSLPGDQREKVAAARQIVRDLEAEMRLTADMPDRRDDIELASMLARARAELDRCLQAARAAHPDFMPDDLCLDELLALIPESGALVAPLFTPKGSAIFVLTHARRW